MATKRKRQARAKRSLTRLPKGLPIRSSNGSSSTSMNTAGGVNPFEVVQHHRHATKRPKFEVHNRSSASSSISLLTINPQQQQRKLSALAVALKHRQQAVRQIRQDTLRANVFHDERIGEYDTTMSVQEQTLRRLVQERSRQSKRQRKYTLSDDNNNNNDDNDDDNDVELLTHKGKTITSMTAKDHVMLSDDDDDENDGYGNLNAMDTQLHFGGGGAAGGSASNKARSSLAAYGPASITATSHMLDAAYAARKEELEDWIEHRKTVKAAKLHNKEQQAKTFTALDEQFDDLKQLLAFRDEQKKTKQQPQQPNESSMSLSEGQALALDRKSEKLMIVCKSVKPGINDNDNDDDDDMDAWNREMKQYMNMESKHKVRAVDRIKTLDEIAQEEAERLRRLEVRRLARMRGEVLPNDAYSDLDDDDKNNNNENRTYATKRLDRDHPEYIENSDEENEQDDKKEQIRFTADGLVRLDKHGVVIGKVGESQANQHLDDSSDGDTQDDSPDDGGDGGTQEGGHDDVGDEDSNSDSHNEGDEDDNESDNEEDEHQGHASKKKDDVMTTANNSNQSDPTRSSKILSVGTGVSASYRATEQYDGSESWFTGKVVAVHHKNDVVTYDIEYDDGDFEEHVQARHVQELEKTEEDQVKDSQLKEREAELEWKRQRAKQKARSEIPYILDVPTTLDAFHDLVSKYAKTGNDVSLIIQRIHAANSVRLDKRNSEKMQNFYDVLLRRFVAVGDAMFDSGDGGAELGRYQQLTEITKTLYAIAHDAPDLAGAVWSRRIGIFHNAHCKRLRDAELGIFADINDEDVEEGKEEDDELEGATKPIATAWPSTGVILILRAMGHVFPVTDLRHYVVTPAMLLLAQIVSQTPILSIYDLVAGTLCSGLLLEYTKEAKRIVPEANAFLASLIRLFAGDPLQRRGSYPLPTVAVAYREGVFTKLRFDASQYGGLTHPQLAFDRRMVFSKDTPAALLYAALNIVESMAKNFSGALESAERETFSEITKSVLALDPKNISAPLPVVLQYQIAATAGALADTCKPDEPRMPLQRRAGPSIQEKSIKSLAPRLEDPEKFSLYGSKNKGKSATQAEADRVRREYKREKKAIARELRIDGTLVEEERRLEKAKKDSAARMKRQKAFAWLEGEQASMNQQVRLGGGLLKGGGMGAAKAKAATARLGIKKGGKF